MTWLNLAQTDWFALAALAFITAVFLLVVLLWRREVPLRSIKALDAIAQAPTRATESGQSSSA